MNLLGYEAGNVGNHEFNYGLEYLQTCLRGAQFPYINANIYVAGENEQNYFTPSGKLKEPDAHRILHMSFEGEPMDMQRSYLVATNNYRAFSSTLSIRAKNGLYLLHRMKIGMC